MRERSADLDHHLLVVDFGHFELLGKGGLAATPGSGKVWQVSLD